MAGEIFNYDSKPVLIATGATDRKLTVPGKIVHIFIPAGVVASMKVGARDKDAIPLKAGWQRFTFTNPPREIYLTASAGDPVTVFSTEDVCMDFFGETASEVFAPIYRRYWPTDDALGGAWDVNAMNLDGSGNVYWIRTGNSQMSDDATVNQRQHVGRLGGTNLNANEDQIVQATGEGHFFRLITEQPEAGGGPLPEFMRMAFWRCSLRVHDATITWGNRTGFFLRTFRTGVSLWAPETGILVDRAGLGLCGGNGDGLWHFKSKQDDTGVLAGFLEDTVLTWPVSLGATPGWVTVTLVLISATATKTAKFELWTGADLAIERNYNADGTAAVLPLSQQLPVDVGLGFLPFLGGQGLSSVGQRLFVRDYETSVSPVHPITKEIISGL